MYFREWKKRHKNIWPILSYQINIRENEGAINNRQSRETGNIGYTRHKTKTNETSAKIYISDLLQANNCYSEYNTL
jgi:hypothetical protein